MWVCVQHEASHREVEGGGGLITRLGVRIYERLAMLSSILRVMYINPEPNGSGAWKQSSDDESLKCWNLERILEAEQVGDMKPEDLTINDLLGDLEEEC
ncbi:hypothetical protein ACHAXH_001558 [Discostella pseudostelligera]